MHYHHANFHSLLQGALASPIAEPAAEVETRDMGPSVPNFGDFPWPTMPALRRKFYLVYLTASLT
jgi:hypothetical protein